MTATRSNRPERPVQLRICDGNGEHIEPASVAAVERIFAHGAAIGAGTEISVTDGEVSLVAVALDTGEADAEGEVGQFWLMSVNVDHASLAEPLPRSEALRQFRRFVMMADSETLSPKEGVSP